MSYRLGEYECPSCGHRQAAPPPPEPPVSSKAASPPDSPRSPAALKLQNSSGPLLHRDENTYGGGWTPAAAPPPPEPERVFNLGGDPPEKFFESDRHGMVKHTQLPMEKNVLFWLNALWTMGGMISGFSSGPGQALSSIIWGSLALFALWMVLHSEEVWPKWACAGCVVLSWVSLLGILFGSQVGFWSTLQQRLPYAGVPAWLSYMALSLHVLGDLWLLTILARDIRAYNEAN